MKSQVVLSTIGIFETIFYCSFTSYYLSVEHIFLDNHFLSGTNDTDFDWYSKCGGGNYGLKVIFRLKDDKGHISNPYLTPLDLNTKIVHDNGSTTTLMYLSTLK